MLNEELVFIGTCDLAGHVRGKGLPARDLDARRGTGVGWTPSNLMLSAVGPIWETPFGTAGDLMIVPDMDTRARVDFADGSPVEHLILGDIRTPDGKAWACCPRDFLRRAVAELRGLGVEMIAAFEQEFVYQGVEARPGDPYSLSAFRRAGGFGGTLVAALREAGLQPESFLAEFGTAQYEVSVAPNSPLRAADEAVITREMARATALRMGGRAMFSPMPVADGTGNGVHIHFSFRDAAGEPVTHDPADALGLSSVARRFCAGVLAQMPALCAITAPAPVSYFRLTPNRWAPTLIDIRAQDRAAALRVCPVFAPESEEDAARRFNIEFRVADAAASPYLALGALIFAGADGLRRGMDLPTGSSSPLPQSLGEAVELVGRRSRGTGVARIHAVRRLSAVQTCRDCACSRHERGRTVRAIRRDLLNRCFFSALPRGVGKGLQRGEPGRALVVVREAQACAEELSRAFDIFTQHAGRAFGIACAQCGQQFGMQIGMARVKMRPGIAHDGAAADP